MKENLPDDGTIAPKTAEGCMRVINLLLLKQLCVLAVK
jgi:hypothetical protein